MDDMMKGIVHKTAAEIGKYKLKKHKQTKVNFLYLNYMSSLNIKIYQFFHSWKEFIDLLNVKKMDRNWETTYLLGTLQQLSETNTQICKQNNELKALYYESNILLANAKTEVANKEYDILHMQKHK